MKKSEIYEMNLFDEDDFYSEELINENTQKIEEVMKSLEKPEHDTTEQTNVEELESGESLKIALRKLAKSVADYISHKADQVAHITAAERTAWNAKLGAEKIAANLTTDTDGMVLAAAMGKNLKEQIDTNANAISTLNSNLFINACHKTVDISQTGWYRICCMPNQHGDSNTPYFICIGQNYYKNKPTTAVLLASECYQYGYLEKITSHRMDSNNYTIDKVRLAGSVNEKYVDVHIISTSANYYSFSVTASRIRWELGYIDDADAGTVFSEIDLFS
ncbi:MAG: hypothetical protein IJF03_10145 [Lachnospiraceae bacterium]|nr:hypothetical protein [Lachnospiraceae bacterium]